MLMCVEMYSCVECRALGLAMYFSNHFVKLKHHLEFIRIMFVVLMCRIPVKAATIFHSVVEVAVLLPMQVPVGLKALSLIHYTKLRIVEESYGRI